MKDYQNKGKPTSTRAILPEEKQGMSLNNLDFVSISLQEIDEIPQSVDMLAVQPMPNIISPRKQTGEKGKSKANPNAAAVADKVLKKWGIDRKTAQELMNAHLPLSDIKLSPTVQKGRQSSAKKVDKPLKIDKTEKIEKVKKLENTSKTPSENILKETYQASYEPITPKTQPEKPKKSSKNNKKEKNKAKNKAKGSANLAKESCNGQWKIALPSNNAVYLPIFNLPIKRWQNYSVRNGKCPLYNLWLMMNCLWWNNLITPFPPMNCKPHCCLNTANHIINP
ncbi:MAG: hypothetical protein IJV56_09120 [Neisseriaceae bacterium]|nr:hypothetical protein [Neisseriaceae bacterium]